MLIKLIFIIHEPDEISIPNGKFKGSARWQQRLGLWDQGFQLHHFGDMIIRQNREAVLIVFKGLFHAFFNAGVKRGAKDQGIISIRVGDRVQPVKVSQAVFERATVERFNSAMGTSD